MNTLSIDPRFVPAQLNLMRSRRPPSGAPENLREKLKRLAAWLRTWRQTMIAELLALGAGTEKAL